MGNGQLEETGTCGLCGGFGKISCPFCEGRGEKAAGYWEESYENISEIKGNPEGGLLCPLCKGKGHVLDYDCSEGQERKSAENAKGGVCWSVIEKR
jgi:RecJ-like exonuclease